MIVFLHGYSHHVAREGLVQLANVAPNISQLYILLLADIVGVSHTSAVPVVLANQHPVALSASAALA